MANTTNPHYDEADLERYDPARIDALEVELEALGASLHDAERGLLRYEEALRRIEGFGVDNDDRGARWMGEVAREALSP